MKILLIKLAKGFYGGEKQTKEWADGLRELGNEVTLLTLPASELNKQVTGVNKYEFNLFPYPDTRPKSLIFVMLLPYHWFRGYFTLKKVVKEHQCEVICIQEPYEKIVFTPLARLFKLKIVWLDILYLKPYLVNNFVLMPWLKFSARFVTLMAASSKYINTELNEIFPKNKTKIIRHVLKDEEVGVLKNLSEIKYPIKTLGFIGSLSDSKGIITLIEAFRNISLDYPNVRLVYAGKGMDEKGLFLKIKEYQLEDKVKLLGKVNKLDFFKQVDLVIVPSHYENVPYVLHEAMFTRRMIVASKTGGIPELFPGENKRWLAKPNNVESLIVKINEALSLSQVEMKSIIQENYLAIEKSTDYRQMILDVDQIFKEAVNQV